jgi:putative resolvase
MEIIIKNSDDMYVAANRACKYYGVTPKTMWTWAKANKIHHIKTAGGRLRYWINDESTPMSTSQDLSQSQTEIKRIVYGYARVSGAKQRIELDHQVEFIRKKYPEARIQTDIGSSLTFGRASFLRVLEHVCLKRVSTLVVTHKDRLSRFSFDAIQWICKRHGTNIVVLGDENHPTEDMSPESELMEDILAITHSFSSRLYARRRYNKTTRGRPEDGSNTSDSVCAQSSAILSND